MRELERDPNPQSVIVTTDPSATRKQGEQPTHEHRLESTSWQELKDDVRLRALDAAFGELDEAHETSRSRPNLTNLIAMRTRHGLLSIRFVTSSSTRCIAD